MITEAEFLELICDNDQLLNFVNTSDALDIASLYLHCLNSLNKDAIDRIYELSRHFVYFDTTALIALCDALLINKRIVDYNLLKYLVPLLYKDHFKNRKYFNARINNNYVGYMNVVNVYKIILEQNLKSNNDQTIYYINEVLKNDKDAFEVDYIKSYLNKIHFKPCEHDGVFVDMSMSCHLCNNNSYMFLSLLEQLYKSDKYKSLINEKIQNKSLIISGTILLRLCRYITNDLEYIEMLNTIMMYYPEYIDRINQLVESKVKDICTEHNKIPVYSNAKSASKRCI